MSGVLPAVAHTHADSPMLYAAVFLHRQLHIERARLLESARKLGMAKAAKEDRRGAAGPDLPARTDVPLAAEPGTTHTRPRAPLLHAEDGTRDCVLLLSPSFPSGCRDSARSVQAACRAPQPQPSMTLPSMTRMLGRPCRGPSRRTRF